MVCPPLILVKHNLLLSMIRYKQYTINVYNYKINPENIASNKLNIKLGFKEEGLKKDGAYNKRTGEFEDRLIYGLINSKCK